MNNKRKSGWGEGKSLLESSKKFRGSLVNKSIDVTDDSAPEETVETPLTWKVVARLELDHAEDDQWIKCFIVSQSSGGHFSRSIRLDFNRKTSKGTNRFISIPLRDEVIKQLDKVSSNGYSFVGKAPHYYLICPIDDGVTVMYAKDWTFSRSPIGLSNKEIRQIQIYSRLFDEFHGEHGDLNDCVWSAVNQLWGSMSDEQRLEMKAIFEEKTSLSLRLPSSDVNDLEDPVKKKWNNNVIEWFKGLFGENCDKCDKEYNLYDLDIEE